MTATSAVTVCQSSVWGHQSVFKDKHYCVEEILVYAFPASLIVVFGLLRLRQISDYPVVLMPRSVVHSVRTSASMTIMLLLGMCLFIHMVHHDVSTPLILSQSFTLIGWVFATLILHREHARALSQTWVLRTWWVLQLLAATIKLHAFIRYQQNGGHQTFDFFLFIIMYTLLVIVALVAFVQRDNFPRYSPVSVSPEDSEIGNMVPRQGGPREVQNWSKTETCNPVEHFSPSSQIELVQAIKHAHKSQLQVRLRGSGSSSSPLSCTNACLVSMDKLNKVLYVDKRHSTVRVEAGMLLADLNDTMVQFGMATTCVSSNTAQTIGGAVATGAHGSSLRFGSLSDAIIELVIVMANGEMCHISTSSNAELLDAARVSLGTLGVIYSVTIQCEMAFALQLEDALEPLDEALASIDDQLQRNDHFEMLWFPFTTTVLTRQLNRTELPATPPPSDFLFCVDKDAASKRIARFTLKLGTLIPRMVPFLSHFLARRVISTRDLVSPSHTAFAAMDQRHLGPFQESEFAVGLGDARAAIAELRRYVDSNVAQGFFLHYPVHLRFAAMDRSYLSPSYGRQTCYIAVRCHISTPNFKAFFHGFEEVMARFGARPNFATWQSRDVVALRTQFPEFDRFSAIRARMDPTGMFSSPYIDQILGPVEADPVV